jgi:hypothetical protein
MREVIAVLVFALLFAGFNYLNLRWKRSRGCGWCSRDGDTSTRNTCPVSRYHANTPGHNRAPDEEPGTVARGPLFLIRPNPATKESNDNTN